MAGRCLIYEQLVLMKHYNARCLCAATSDVFACEEEPAHEMSELSVTGRLEEMRISELQRRNKAELPHMRSAYALETLVRALNVPHLLAEL